MSANSDCDDTAAAVSPAAAEACDGADNDCDGSTTYDTGSSLSYVEVSYGGGYNGNVHVNNNGSRVSVANATISDSSSYGIYRASSATPTLTNTTYSANASGTLY